MGATADADKQGGAGNPIWWGLAIAIVAIAAAASYRLAVSDGGFIFSGSAEGFKLISEAKAELTTATAELDDLRRQIEAKDAALKKVAADLTDRESQIQRLLAQLEQATHAAAPSPAVQAANDQLAQLRAAGASSAAQSSPTVDWSKYTTATARINSANTALSKIAPQKK
jgi:Skp family chaperone for outer membrane proteins